MPGPSREEPEDRNEDDLTFPEWLAKVNERIADKLEGLGLDDLRDRMTMDAWEEGRDPVEFADEVIREEALEGGLDEEDVEELLSDDDRPTPTRVDYEMPSPEELAAQRREAAREEESAQAFADSMIDDELGEPRKK